MRKIIFSSIVIGSVATFLLAQGMMGPMMGGMMKSGMSCPMRGGASQNVKPIKYTPIKGWNDKQKIAQGKKIFLQNCAICHGANAQGGMGPSLNGLGHVIHHSPKKLLTQINNGGGGMPAFGNKLSKEEQESILIYLHSLWPKKIQESYDKKFNVKK